MGDTTLASNMLKIVLERAFTFENKLSQPDFTYEIAKASFLRLESLWGTLQQTASPFDLAKHEAQIERLDRSLARSRARLEQMAPRQPWWKRLLGPVLQLVGAVAALLGFPKLSRALSAGASTVRALLPESGESSDLRPKLSRAVQFDLAGYRSRRRA